MVLDDAVVDEHDGARRMWMGVHLARTAMRRPPCVPDPGGAEELARVDGAHEIVELSDRPDDLHCRPIVHREARRVVPPILDLSKAIEHDGSGGRGPDVSNGATHGCLALAV